MEVEQVCGQDNTAEERAAQLDSGAFEWTLSAQSSAVTEDPLSDSEPANPGYRIGNRMGIEWTYCDSWHGSEKKRRIQTGAIFYEASA
jgi:hypothetical protein